MLHNPIRDHVETGPGDPDGERGDQRGRGVAHVVADHDPAGLVAQAGRERLAQRLHHALVELLADQAPDVVGLDDLRIRVVLGQRTRSG